jgi:hypothetical protein
MLLVRRAVSIGKAMLLEGVLERLVLSSAKVCLERQGLSRGMEEGSQEDETVSDVSDTVG